MSKLEAPEDQKVSVTPVGAQWGHALKTFVRRGMGIDAFKSMKGKNHFQKGGLWGNRADWFNFATGLIAGDAQVIRSILAPFGLLAGHIANTYGGEPEEDPENETRKQFTKAVRPKQHPGETAYFVALATPTSQIGSGVSRMISSGNPMVGLSEVLNGTFTFASFMKTVLLKEPQAQQGKPPVLLDKLYDNTLEKLKTRFNNFAEKIPVRRVQENFRRAFVKPIELLQKVRPGPMQISAPLSIYFNALGWGGVVDRAVTKGTAEHYFLDGLIDPETIAYTATQFSYTMCAVSFIRGRKPTNNGKKEEPPQQDTGAVDMELVTT